MQQVFQEILQMATAKLRQALRDGQGGLDTEGFDPDVWEGQVRQFTRQLGHQMLQVWAEEKVEQAHAEAAFCWCGMRRHVHKRKVMWWRSTFGQVQIAEPCLVCPKAHGKDRPFQRLTGLRCRGKTKALKRVLTDFGAEKSFAAASEQLWEHYGIRLDRSSIRQVVRQQAQRAEKFVASQHQGAVSAYQTHKGLWEGQRWLIVESDGSMVRTGKLEPAKEGGLSPKSLLPKRHRQTHWREVRLSTVQRPGEDQRLYGAVMGGTQQAGEQMFGLALLMGWGEQTLVHGVGDGAPWIAQQIAEVFPKQRYLLDRYHLLEHLYTGAETLPVGFGLSAAEWVKRQLGAIDAAQVDKVVLECRAIAGQNADHPLEGLARYLDNQRGHLDYSWAQAQGLPIGSGAVEGGHRYVIQQRLKLPGAWWSEESVNPMLALRTLRANGCWGPFWN
jgi:hypothetical protein